MTTIQPPKNFVYSDDRCCFRCSLMYFDMIKREYCKRTGLPVRPYNKACADFNEICGRFGEMTKRVEI